MQLPNDILAKREKEILSLIVREYTSTEIADRLNLSIHTVDTHRKNIIKKTRSKSLVSLVKYAIRCGLLENYYFRQRQPKSNS